MVVSNRGRFSKATAARIKRARAERGWSCEKLEDLAALGRGTVSRIETGSRGKSLSIDVIVSIAKAFGLTLGELVYGERE